MSNSSSHRPTPKELRLSFVLPTAIILAVWVIGAVVIVIWPLQYTPILGGVIGVSLLVYLVYWTRQARRALRIRAVLFALPALAGITWSVVDGRINPMLLGLLITLALLFLQRTLDTPLSYRAAYQQFSRGNVDAAFDLINRSVDARPDFWQSYQMRALIHLMRLHFRQAEADAREAIRLRPDAHPALNTLGQVYLAQNRFAEAEAAYAAALAAAPDYALYLYHHGLSLYRQEKYRAAADALAAATRGTLPLDSYDLQAYFYLGRSLEALGEGETAASAYQTMTRFRDALPALHKEIHDQPAYPHAALLKADLAAMKQRLAAAGTP
ncbi:MAG: tetratricopeptide repeat protein [Anaerolineales bacterium]|nr:tetratricopeptide repeat protein [Anaerolineales bacterium]